jgi:DNA topoisomerase-1
VAKNLIIVESPAKTRTLKKFLGGSFDVEASRGHIRDLAKRDMGIGEGYEPRYEVLSEKKDVVKRLRQVAKKADTVFLAPDPDREGEAIAWHIAEILGKDPAAIHRVTLNEITRQAVEKALENPGRIDQRKVDAQQTRRILDRLMGFRLSPLLWEKVKQGLSAGRVQSVALKMVCDRQAEIDAFEPQEYWLIDATLAASKPPRFTARLHMIDGRRTRVENEEQAAAIAAAIEEGPLAVAKVEKKESRQRPSPPFITSRLQQEAARRFGFPVRMTMSVAQALYEGKEIGDQGSVGLITYMRTDSTRIAQEAIDAVRDHIDATYGADKLPSKPNTYPNKKGAQDAHEAIRPTSLDLPPAVVKPYLKPEELKLYELVWNRFVASQMTPAVFDVTQIDVGCGPYTLRATGRILKKPGFLEVYRETPEEDGPASLDRDDSAELPPVEEGDKIELVQIDRQQKFTQPPARYTEATLVKALEENGIGRPSTYATILATLTDREYCEKVEKRFRPTALGKFVSHLLQEGFNDIINEQYTAELESQLDRIEDGSLDWKEALGSFDDKFSHDLDRAARQMPNVKRDGVPTDESCPDCGRNLVMRFGRYGAFLGCKSYPDCTYTRDLDSPNGGGEGEEEVAPCEKCGSPMVLKRSRYGPFYGCSAYPECKNTRRAGPAGEPPKPTGVACPSCGEGMIEEKRSRRGKIFYSCNRYPECEFALWNKPVDRRCPQCDAPLLVIKTTKRHGTRLLCHDKECDFTEQVEGAEAEQA